MPIYLFKLAVTKPGHGELPVDRPLATHREQVGSRLSVVVSKAAVYWNDLSIDEVGSGRRQKGRRASDILRRSPAPAKRLALCLFLPIVRRVFAPSGADPAWSEAID